MLGISVNSSLKYSIDFIFRIPKSGLALYWQSFNSGLCLGGMERLSIYCVYMQYVQVNDLSYLTGQNTLYKLS